MDIVGIQQLINLDYLTELVQKAAHQPGLTITDWNLSSIHGGVEEGSSVYRLSGEARDGSQPIPWSLILKTISPTDKARQPDGIWYWKREVEAYKSGLLYNLPGGNVTAPACYGVEEHMDGSAWLWLEDIKEDVTDPWPIEQYADAARHLGRFNGTYLAGEAMPNKNWIPRNWLRKYVEHASPMIEFIHQNPGNPVVNHMLPGDALAQMLAVWDEHERILDVLESLPQVFCHQDAFKRNLFARGGRTIAIDWGYLGNAPVGAELVALVAGSIGFFEIPVEKVKDLDRLCFEGYLLGLRDSGWQGDPRVVRIGYTVTLMLRYPIGGSVGEMLPQFLGQETGLKVGTAFENKTTDELQKTDPAILAYYQGILPEAMKLLGVKKLVTLLGRMGIHKLRMRRAGKQ